MYELDNLRAILRHHYTTMLMHDDNTNYHGRVLWARGRESIKTLRPEPAHKPKNNNFLQRDL